MLVDHPLGPLAPRRVLVGTSAGAGVARRSRDHRLAPEPGLGDRRPRPRPGGRDRDPERRRRPAVPSRGRTPRSPGGRCSDACSSTDPQGWTADGPPGSIAYDESDLDDLLGPDGDATVLVYVGPIPRVQAGAGAGPGLRRGPRRLPPAGIAADLGRAPGRVGGRPPRHRRRGTRGRRHLLRRLAGTRRPAVRARRRATCWSCRRSTIRSRRCRWRPWRSVCPCSRAAAGG